MVISLLWWLSGLLGSVISLQHFKIKYGLDNSDLIFGFTMTFLGPINLLSAILFRLIVARPKYKGNWKITDWLNK